MYIRLNNNRWICDMIFDVKVPVNINVIITLKKLFIKVNENNI